MLIDNSNKLPDLELIETLSQNANQINLSLPKASYLSNVIWTLNNVSYFNTYSDTSKFKLIKQFYKDIILEKEEIPLDPLDSISREILVLDGLFCLSTLNSLEFDYEDGIVFNYNSYLKTVIQIYILVFY